MNSNLTKRQWVGRTAIGGAIVLSLAGAYAFKTVFQRPGESAFRLIPANALAVASIDLTPSPAQALTFKRLDDAFEKYKVENVTKKTLLDLAPRPSAVESIKPFIKPGLAACLIECPDKADDTTLAGLIALKDTEAVQNILNKQAQTSYWKGTKYYTFPKDTMSMMIVDNTLVLSDRPWALREIAKVQSGETPSILTQNDFITARGRTDGDANVMFLVSPKAMEKGSKGLHTTMPTKDWLSLSLTVKDGGLAFAVDGKMDVTQKAEYEAVAKAAPLRSDLFQVLPSGAYGAFAISQPSLYMDSAKSAASESDNTKKSLAEFEESLTKETGLDYKKDLLPALSGNAVMAIYPSESDLSGFDAMVLIDDLNGADPAALAGKIQQYVERQMSKNDTNFVGTHFDPITLNGANGFKLQEKAQASLRKSLGDTGTSPIKKGKLATNKTLAWAMVDKAVIFASSEDLLSKAVTSYKSKSASLASDGAMKTSTVTFDGAQGLTMLNLARIAEGIKHTMDLTKMSPDAAQTARDIFSMFEDLKEPFVMSAKMSPDGRTHTELMIPLDYDQTIRFAGKLFNPKPTQSPSAASARESARVRAK